MMKNTYLEVLNDFFDQTYIITEYTDNKNNLYFRAIKIIKETPVKDGIIITYITDKKQISLLDNRMTHTQVTGNLYNTIDTSASCYYNAINLGLNTPAKSKYDNNLDTLYEIAEYLKAISK